MSDPKEGPALAFVEASERFERIRKAVDAELQAKRDHVASRSNSTLTLIVRFDERTGEPSRITTRIESAAVLIPRADMPDRRF